MRDKICFVYLENICEVYYCCKLWFEEVSNFQYYSLYYNGFEEVFEDFSCFLLVISGSFIYFEDVLVKKYSFFVFLIVFNVVKVFDIIFKVVVGFDVVELCVDLLESLNLEFVVI